MKSGFSNLDGEFNRDIILSFWNPTKYTLKVVRSFIHSFWRHKLQRQRDRTAARAAQVWELKSSICGNWPSRSEEDRSQSGYGEMESLASLQSPQKVREPVDAEASGARVEARRSKEQESQNCSASEVRAVASPLSPTRPAAGQPRSRSGRELRGVTQSDTEQWAPDTVRCAA